MIGDKTMGHETKGGSFRHFNGPKKRDLASPDPTSKPTLKKGTKETLSMFRNQVNPWGAPKLKKGPPNLPTAESKRETQIQP